MSLQVWLPLTKDLRQQGLGNFNISTMGTLSFVNGKLGKAINFNNATSSTNAIVIDSNLCEELGTEYSAAVWVCPLGSHVDYNGCIISSGNWNTPNKRWSFGLSSNNSQVDVFGFNYNTYINCDIPINTWTHITCVHKNGITKLYKNGIYVGEKQMAQSALDSDKTFTRIGMCSYGNFFGFNGNISDLRIYDHALSPMEVKQLSQGLVLHYPLNRNGWGQENLFKNSSLTDLTSDNLSSKIYYQGSYIPEITSNGIKFTWTGSSAREIDLWLDTNLKADTYYTLSFIYRNNMAISSSFYLRNNGSLVGYWSQPTIPYSENWAKYSCTFKIANYQTNDATTGTLLTLFYSGYTANKWIELKQNSIKLEEGSLVTPWCPANTDELTTIMGLNSTTEYDCSGFCNNGTWHGVHTNISDTPKYAVSTTATGSSTTYLEGPILPEEAKTVALWIKNTSKSSNGAIFNDKTTGLQIGLLNSLLYMNSKASTAGFTTTHWVNGEWNHVVAINNNGTRSLYVNGQPETQSGASNYYIHNADNCWLWNRSYNNNYPFNGSLSDLRIYATALSAEDVKSLYQNCATIDPDGTIRGQIRS